jgi:hypothetical protein
MAFFTELISSLKQKWLQYFQVNRVWIAREMELEYVATPDGGRRPSSYLILGVVSVLEPQLVQLLEPFTRLNPDLNALIDVLDLNFDPEKFGDELLPTGNPPVLPTANPNADIDALMGMGNEQQEALRESSRVEVVDKTTPEISQSQSSELGTTGNQRGDVWLDELNQGTNLESEQTLDKTRTREGNKSGEDEISRLFPEF